MLTIVLSIIIKLFLKYRINNQILIVKKFVINSYIIIPKIQNKQKVIDRIKNKNNLLVSVIQNVASSFCTSPCKQVLPFGKQTNECELRYNNAIKCSN